jgi:GTP-dependent phosphoenolpyruvate carboxykinase
MSDKNKDLENGGEPKDVFGEVRTVHSDETDNINSSVGTFANNTDINVDEFDVVEEQKKKGININFAKFDKKIITGTGYFSQYKLRLSQ